MTIKRFRALSNEAQYDTVKEFATFLLARKTKGISVLLYQLGSFYIEVYYDTRKSELQELKSFEGTEALEPHLQMVNIIEIYALLRQ